MNSFFLTNYTEQTFLERIRENLRTCNSFSFSVSFIKKAGLVLLIKDIEAALARGVKGRVITSTYQNFTDIDSLTTFLMLSEKYDLFECHLDFECFHDDGYRTIGYHSKGYYFEFSDDAELVVGSSNITRYALLKNIEWDLVVHAQKENIVFNKALEEFNEKWNNTFELEKEIISKYVNKLNYAIERWDMDYNVAVDNISPNYMQRKALKELNRYRVMGMQKALVVAATGSGKTYLAAFDVRNFNPQKLLYIVHEGSILQKALETFKNVFGAKVTYGIFNKDNSDLDADFIFAGNIKLSQSLHFFEPEEFDYIILDEFHRCGAQEWGKGVTALLDLYADIPILGLSATNIRYLDNQRDMADELFDGNIASEMTLGDAIVRGILAAPKYVISIYSYQKELEKYKERVRYAQNKAVRDEAERYLEALRRALGSEAEPFMTWNGRKWHIDLKAVNALWLQKAGVQHIDICEDCTCCRTDLYWSHRKTGLQRGEQAALIALREVTP